MTLAKPNKPETRELKGNAFGLKFEEELRRMEGEEEAGDCDIFGRDSQQPLQGMDSLPSINLELT